jgi:inner membrane protein involved in colicin E2 resistance
MTAMPLVEFPVETGGTLLVMVTDQRSVGPTMRGGFGQQAIDQADRTFERALGTIGTVARGVLGQLQGLAVRPEEITVEFGIELTGKTNSVLVAAGASAQLKVGLTWRPAAADVKGGSAWAESTGTESARAEA